MFYFFILYSFILYFFKIIGILFKLAVNVNARCSSNLKSERDQLTARRNSLSAALKKARESGTAALHSLTTESQQIRDRLAETKAEVSRLEETVLLEVLRLPNVAAAAPATDQIVYQARSAKQRVLSRTHQELMSANNLGEFSNNR